MNSKDNAISFAKWVNKRYMYKHEKLLFSNSFELDYGDGISWDEAYKIYLTEK